MEKITKKFANQLKPFLHRLILAVSIDDQLINEGKESTLFGEEIKIYFSGNAVIKITTDDIPHFYGEGDLELEFKKENYIDESISKFKNKEISEIKIYGWKKKGINLSKVARYFVQIEFYHIGELLLSSGFFYFDQSTNKMECLITGELSADCMQGLSINDFEENLSVEIIA